MFAKKTLQNQNNNQKVAPLFVYERNWSVMSDVKTLILYWAVVSWKFSYYFLVINLENIVQKQKNKKTMFFLQGLDKIGKWMVIFLGKQIISVDVLLLMRPWWGIEQ